MTVIHVLGAGGHGQDVACIARARRLDVVFHDDNIPSYPPTSELEAEDRWVVGVNDPQVRKAIALRAWASTAHRLIHPWASFAHNVTIYPGSCVGAHTDLGPETLLWRHVHVGPGCTLTRATVGEFTTISPGVTVAGDVEIGSGCLIGAGAVISNLVKIGRNVTVAAGAVVPPDTTLPDGTTWISRERKAEQTLSARGQR